jgi:hypothetical protein
MGIRAAFYVGQGVWDARVLRLFSFRYEREDAANVVADLMATIDDFGIDPSALTSDTASTTLKAGTKINKARLAAGRRPIARVGCVNHATNLVLKAMDKGPEMQRFKSMLRKVGSTFTNPRVHPFLSRSGSQRRTFRSTTEVRWNCVKYTVEDIVALGDMLTIYLDRHPGEEEDQALKNGGIVLGDLLAMASSILPLLEKFAEFFKFFESGDPRQIAMYALVKHEMEVTLKGAPEWLAAAAGLSIDKIHLLSEKHREMQSEFIISAALLNPDVRSGGRTMYHFPIASEPRRPSATRSRGAPMPPPRGGSFQQQWERGHPPLRGGTPRQSRATPILPEPLVPSAEYDEFAANLWKIVTYERFVKDGVIKFWHESALQWPYLAQVALKILMTPASSAPIESFFSTGGWFDGARRAPEQLEMLALLKANWDLAKPILADVIHECYSA